MRFIQLAAIAAVFLALPEVSQATLTYDRHEILSQIRVGRTVFEYEMRIYARNDGAQTERDVRASVSSTVGAISVVDADASFGKIDPGATGASSDSIRIRMDRRVQFNPSYLDFQFSAAAPGESDAAQATLSPGLVVRDDIPGFTGSGFVDLAGAGNAVEFEVDAQTPALHQLAFRYAVKTPGDVRNLRIEVDGIPIATSQAFAEGPHGRWEEIALHRYLDFGLHTIRIQALDFNGVLLDRLLATVTPPDPDKFLTFPIGHEAGFTNGGSDDTEAYYIVVDPSDRRDTFAKFQQANGLTTCNGNDPDYAHAVYRNRTDLDFGRDMCVHRRSNGDVVSYVRNFPSREAAIANTGLIATVAMEYRAEEFDFGGPKQTYFYAYDGDGNRIEEIDLDGRGPKSVPGLCNTCHGGKPKPGRVLFRGAIYGSDGDTLAKWIPWDLDNLDFADSPQIREQFRKLNSFILCTNVSASARTVIQGWYNDPSASCGNISGASSFNGDYVPPGWATQPVLYREVFAPSCRSCHLQRGTTTRQTDLEFASFAVFSSYKDRIESMVYEQGTMPGALKTFEIFWRGNQPQILDSALFGGTAHLSPSFAKWPTRARNAFGDRRMPGLPIARIAGMGNVHSSLRSVRVGDQAVLIGGLSPFAATYQWRVIDYPSRTSLPSINASDQSTATFQPVGSRADFSRFRTECISSSPPLDCPEPYEVRLDITGTHGGGPDSVEATLWTDSTKRDVDFDYIYEQILDEPGGYNASYPAWSCTRCHRNVGGSTTARDIFEMYNVERDNGQFTPEEALAIHKLEAWLAITTRIDCDNPQDSLILRKPLGEHHFPGAKSGFSVGSSEYENFLRWIVNGAKLDDSFQGCPLSN